jgi:carbon monoxide dehydrogenase subunit G
MKIQKKFEILSPIDRIWSVLVDPYQVVGCLPGAQITQRIAVTGAWTRAAQR